jgi:hypothetical protein
MSHRPGPKKPALQKPVNSNAAHYKNVQDNIPVIPTPITTRGSAVRLGTETVLPSGILPPQGKAG